MGIERKLQEQKTELKEKKMLSLQRKELKDQGHTVPDITKKDFEMQLRKIATQGVVRLFNTVQEFQGRNEDEVQRRQVSKLPVKKKGDKMAQQAQESFEAIWE